MASNEFSRDIPPLVMYGENTLRIVVMVLAFLMPLEMVTIAQRRGVWHVALACGFVAFHVTHTNRVRTELPTSGGDGCEVQ